MNIGENIRQLRQKKGMSQVQLAERIAISQSMLCQIERGTKTLTLPLSVEIADALGCSLDSLIVAQPQA